MKRIVFFIFVYAIGVLVSCKTGPPFSPRSGWADVVLRATGVGALRFSEGIAVKDRILAIQEAKLDAYQKLEEEVLRLKMDDQQTVVEFIEKDPKLPGKVRSFVRGARIVYTRVVSMGQIEVDTELFLGENFMAVLGLIERKISKEQNRMGPQRPRGNMFK